MGRLKTVEISTALRTALAAATFTGFELATIPTGRDPRRFTDADLLPQAVVQFASTRTQPKSIGGGTEAGHQLEVLLLFRFEDGDDLNLLKLAHGTELFDWLCTVKSGTDYKLFISDEGGSQYPELEYDPAEETVYWASGQNIAVIKLSCGVLQKPFFNIN